MVKKIVKQGAEIAKQKQFVGLCKGYKVCLVLSLHFPVG